MKTPILLITFNRPDHVRTALAEVLKQHPVDLYVAQDGPRANNTADVEKCTEVRSIVQEMVSGFDDVSLHTHYSSENLGCGRGPYEAMSWFFSEVEYGIILEDDINPHPLFFKYMEELLARFKDNERIGMVTAHNLYRRYSWFHSYYYTYEPSGTLGWGTYRRVWQDFKFDIPYDKSQFEYAMKHYYHMPRLYRRIMHLREAKWLSGDRHDSWDYQFDYYLLTKGYLNARANSCLTSHEGVGEDATHQGYANPGYIMDVRPNLFEKIRHPWFVHIDIKERFRMYWQGFKYRNIKQL